MSGACGLLRVPRGAGLFTLRKVVMKLQVGDMVQILDRDGNRSRNGKKLRGKVGIIVKAEGAYSVLDIELGDESGIWNDELVRVGFTDLDYEYI